MYHGSLFSGGGGFDLAAEAVGWQNVFHCERDPFCQTVLKHYWPNTDSHADIKNFNVNPYRGLIDIITGGFPCQPFSNAGKRRGTEDDRYLWPEMLRIIREVRPSWVVGENVYGLVNWNDGLVLNTVLSDLEAEGYEVQPYILPAAGIGAPHQRYRVWIVAFNADTAKRKAQTNSNAVGNGRHIADILGTHPFGRNACDRKQSNGLYTPQLAKADSNSDGVRPYRLHGSYAEQAGKSRQYAQHDVKPLDIDASRWEQWPTQPPLCGGDDGLPTELDGITVQNWQTQSLKLYGNAIVPQLAIQLFKTIDAYNDLVAKANTPSAM